MIVLYAADPDQLKMAGVTHFAIMSEAVPKLWIAFVPSQGRCDICDNIPDEGTFQPWNQEGGPGPACRRCLTNFGYDVQEWDGTSFMITNYTEADISVKCDICREAMEILTKTDHLDQACLHVKCRCHENEVCMKPPVMRLP